MESSVRGQVNRNRLKLNERLPAGSRFSLSAKCGSPLSLIRSREYGEQGVAKNAKESRSMAEEQEQKASLGDREEHPLNIPQPEDKLRSGSWFVLFTLTPNSLSRRGNAFRHKLRALASEEPLSLTMGSPLRSTRTLP
jgi:hypothetical protein